MIAKVSSQESQEEFLAFHPLPLSVPATGSLLAGLQNPSSTTSVGLDSSFQGAKKASLADQHQEPIFSSRTASATSSVSRLHPIPQPVPSVITHQVASSTTLEYKTPKPPYQTTQSTSSKHPTLVLSAGPNAVPSIQASSWYFAPPQVGNQGYVSLIDLYPECDSDLEALYKDSPADWELVSYEDILDAPSSSEADPADSEPIHSEDQSYRETVHAPDPT